MNPYQIRLRLGSFRTGSALSKVGILSHLLEALIESNRVYLQKNRAPGICSSGVI